MDSQQNKQNWLGIGTLIVVVALVAFFFGRVLLAPSTNTPLPPTQTSNSSTTQSGQCIDYTEASSHIGENACVRGTIVKVATSNKGTIFLDYCSNYKDCPFSAVIFNSNSGNFPNVSSYQGHVITVKGYIRTYQGRPEIILNTSDQIVSQE